MLAVFINFIVMQITVQVTSLQITQLKFSCLLITELKAS